MKKNEKKDSYSRKNFLQSAFSKENIEALVIAVILALFIRTFIVQAFKIPSGSMEPTLLIGDHILVNKFIYGIRVPLLGKIVEFKKPERGDIVVFVYPLDPAKDFIKRVVAVEGDELLIKNKKIFINGEPFEDTYGVYSDENIINEWGINANRDNLGPIVVPPNSIFTVGDNRDKSYDSRFWGFVENEQVKGKAFIIYWSWEKPFRNIRFNRIGKILH